MSNAYLDRLEAELKSKGVNSLTSSAEDNVLHPSDFNLKTVLDMEKTTGVKYSDEQKQILLHKGNACILACAGSGKTTVSTHLIVKRILTGEIADVNKLIYTTYSKAGATEMKERLDKLLKQLGINKKVQVRTLHSFFLQVLRTFGVQAEIISEKTRTSFVREACKEANFQPKDDELLLIDNLLSFQVNNLLSDRKTMESYVNTIENLTLEQYSKIRNGYSKRKVEKGLIDYDDMQSYLYLWLCKYAKSNNAQEVEISRQVREYCQAVYTDFYIDEAQDVSKIQFAIIRGIVTNPDNPNKLIKGLMLIGDDDQCIYTWRGSDPSIILSAGPMFDIRTFVLSTNYRCKNEIVDYAATGIKCNNNRYDKDMKANNVGGTVKILPSPKEDLCSLSILAVNHIKWWISQGERLNDIAVLSRNNFHLAILSNMLLREGIYCYLTEDMKLTKSSMYKDFKKLIDISKPCWKYETTSDILWKLCRYMGAATSRMIADFQNASSLSLEDTLGYIIKKYLGQDIEFNKQLNISIQADEKLKYYINRMQDDTKSDLKVVYDTIKCGDSKNCLDTLMYQYIVASGYLYKSKDKNRSIHGLKLYIHNLLIKDGFDKMCDFLRVTEQFENGNMGVIGDRITLTTIHSAKGREWKNVIMFACDNVSEPSFDGICNMIEDDINVSDIFENIDEERRLFYVGNTRAKDNLLVLTYGMPSVFILEALGAFGKKANNGAILEYAQDPMKLTAHSQFIRDNIMSEQSKYYYNVTDYLVK